MKRPSAVLPDIETVLAAAPPQWGRRARGGDASPVLERHPAPSTVAGWLLLVAWLPW